MHPYNRSLVENAQRLRKEMTPEEKKLWYDLLKRLPLTVRRQHNIENYIVDFYIAQKKIVIEVDGLQHLSEDGKEYEGSIVWMHCFSTLNLFLRYCNTSSTAKAVPLPPLGKAQNSSKISWIYSVTDGFHWEVESLPFACFTSNSISSSVRYLHSPRARLVSSFIPPKEIRSRVITRLSEAATIRFI